MKLKTQINTVGLVRGIRDAQARRLANRSAVEVIDFFNGAAERAEKRTIQSRLTSASKVPNRGVQPTRRQKQWRADDA
jgi:hypothetical protein